ncbi:helix-turn-helix transcriptional regulator [Paenibacillus terreus]
MNTVPEMSTRRLIMTLLKTRGPLGVSSLAAELGITEMGVRRHLKAMEQEGFIEVAVVRQAMGRPVYKFGLSERGDEQFPRNYDHLLVDLLEELNELQGAGAVDALFEGRKRKLIRRYMPQLEGRSLPARIRKLADIQHTAGYMTYWNTEEDGSFTFYEYNCPIAQAANRYRKACECEQHMFEELLEAEVLRTDCLAEGGRCCRYKILPRQS